MSSGLPRVFINFIGNQHGRNLVAGVCDFLREGHNWDSVLRYENPRQAWPDFKRNRVVGFLGSIASPAQLKAVLTAGVPAVNVARVLSSVPLPSVYSDNRAAGSLAARHLWDFGHRRFAYLGPTGIAYSEDRLAGFRHELRTKGSSCEVFLVGSRRFNEDEMRKYTPQVRTFLTAMPRPCAVFCCNDFFARFAVDMLRRLRIDVPGEIAVLGVNNDLVYCEMAAIPLSSIELNGVKQGYEAARLLARLLHGDAPPAEPIWVPPARVVVRRSTDGLAISDEMVARALRLLRTGAFSPLAVDEIAKEVGVSRRVLELRFQAELGQSPYSEVLRCRLERAKELLTTSALSIHAVASAVGFQEARELHKLFQKRLALTPGEYRRRYTLLTHPPAWALER